MTSGSTEWFLQILSLIGCLLAVVRLIQLKLIRIYPFFFLFLCIPLVLQPVVVLYGVCSREFCSAFPLLEPIRNIAYVLAVCELFHGRRAWAIVSAAAAAPIGLILTFVAPASHLYHGQIFRIVRLERGVALSLAISLLVLLYSIARHPGNLPRNHAVLSIFYSVWFLGDATFLLASSFLPKGLGYVVNDGLALFEIGSYMGWLLLLSRAGATRDRGVLQIISPASA